jgi:hypothetical protein
VFDDPVMKHLPPLVSLAMLGILLNVTIDARRPRRSKHLCLPERFAVQTLDVVPHDELGINKHLDEVAVLCSVVVGNGNPLISDLDKKQGTVKKRKHVLEKGDLAQPVVLVRPVQQVVLLVVVRGQDEEVDNVAQARRRELRVRRNRRRVVHGAVVLGDVEVLVAPERVQHHQRIVAQFQVLSTEGRSPRESAHFRFPGNVLTPETRVEGGNAPRSRRRRATSD